MLVERLRPRRIAAVVVGAALLAVLAAPILVEGAGASPRGEILELINLDRSKRGLRPMRIVDRVSRIARKHSRLMARRGEVFPSSNLPAAIRRYRWSDWGENNACGVSLRRIHRGLMGDRGSRRNILRPRFRRIGIGITQTRSRPAVCDHATYWVTEIIFG